MGLCSLSDVKTWLGISSTTYDAKIQMFIDTVSEQIIGYLGYDARRTTYTSEVHAVNNNQILFLNAQPIQSVTSVICNGETITAGTAAENYAILSNGRLYRGNGWSGNFYTRGMAYDIVAGERSIFVSYVGGWYTPDDVGYVKGNAASLPYAISSACINEVVGIYRKSQAQSEGLTAYKEGGISWNWADPSSDSISGNNFGLSLKTCSILNAYKRWGMA